jgi:predicted metal-dependent phosphoesterase TrpH
VTNLAAGRYDLHTHSSLSDGTTLPAEVVTHAARVGLAGIALTDHDTIEGWADARAAADAAGIDFLPGLEITTKHEGISVHLLGYVIDAAHTELLAELTRIRMSRVNRAEEMVRRLAAKYDIDWSEISDAIAPGGTVGRPHIADALVSRGHFADRGQVFDRILHPASPYYVQTYAIETRDAIRLVSDAGGVSVLAHPAAVRQRGPAPVDLLNLFQNAGLWGVELDHPENRPEWIPPLRERAEQIGLEITGASDFHGTGKMNQLGERTSSAELVQRMRERIATPH